MPDEVATEWEHPRPTLAWRARNRMGAYLIHISVKNSLNLLIFAEDHTKKYRYE